jgi:hypothetical protein
VQDQGAGPICIGPRQPVKASGVAQEAVACSALGIGAVAGGSCQATGPASTLRSAAILPAASYSVHAARRWWGSRRSSLRSGRGPNARACHPPEERFLPCRAEPGSVPRRRSSHAGAEAGGTFLIMGRLDTWAARRGGWTEGRYRFRTWARTRLPWALYGLPLPVRRTAGITSGTTRMTSSSVCYHCP